MTCANYAAPLSLNWTSVPVTDNGHTLSRGILFGIGTPLQYVSLKPAIHDNDSWVMPADGCLPGTKGDPCVGVEGGVFDPSLSSTFYNSTRALWNGTDDSLDPTVSYTLFNDRLEVGTRALNGFPMVLQPDTARK
jgi:hypothetical protein